MNASTYNTVDFGSIAIEANRSAKQARKAGDEAAARRHYAVKDAALSFLIISIDEADVDLSWQETAPNFVKLLISFPHPTGRKCHHAVLDHLTGAARRQVLTRIGRPRLASPPVLLEPRKIGA